MAIEVIFRCKIDLEARINSISNERTKQTILDEIAEVQQYTHPVVLRVGLNECRVRQGWIVHVCRVRNRQAARDFRDYIQDKLVQIGAPSNELVLQWAGWMNGIDAGLPLHKERYAVTEIVDGEPITTYQTRARQGATNEFPLDSELAQYFFQPEREIDDGEGGTITVPAVTDIRRFSNIPRNYAEA